MKLLYSFGRGKAIYECGDDWRRVHTSGYRTGDEYIRVPRGQETSTYDFRRVHTTGYHAADEYIRVPRDQETSTYDHIRKETSTYKYVSVPKAGDQYIPVGRTRRPAQKVRVSMILNRLELDSNYLRLKIRCL